MMHPKRKWTFKTYASVEALVDAMIGQVWTICTGFRLPLPDGALLFLNDSTDEDAAMELGVLYVTPEEDVHLLALEAHETMVHSAKLFQVDSLTGWINPGDAQTLLASVRETVALAPEKAADWITRVPEVVRLQSSEVHRGECCR